MQQQNTPKFWHHLRLPKPTNHCIFCPTAFHDLKQLSMHEETSHRDTVFSNPIEVLVQEGFDTHNSDLNVETYQCQICSVTEKTNASLEAHMIHSHSPDESVQCSHYDKRFSFVDNLRMHMVMDHGEEKLESLTCSHCKFATTNSVEMDNHMNEMHPLSCNLFSKNISAYLNNETSDNTAVVQVPIPTITLDETSADSFQCDKCTLVTETDHELKNHIESYHQFQCSSCPSILDSEIELKTHLLAHEQLDTVNTCHHCEVIIKDSLYLICEKCDFSFHKKCTKYKSSSGNWKPKSWLCNFCSDLDGENQQQNPSTSAHIANSNKTFPNLSGKHIKATAVGCNHREAEFLHIQLNTLKSVIVKREVELKKIEESDWIKAKRIMHLEAQLKEARKFANNPQKQSNENNSDIAT